MSAWRDVFIAQLLERNRKQVKPFERMVQSYQQVHRQNQTRKEQLEKQEKELVILRHEATRASDETRDEKLAKLQKKVAELQEELTNKLRLEIQGASSQLNLTQEVREMYQKLQTQRIELETCQAALEEFKEREPALQHKAEQLEGDVKLVRDELTRVQGLMEAADKEVLALRLQNDDLILRIVTDKSQNADEMNKMNAMVEQLRAQLTALQQGQQGGTPHVPVPASLTSAGGGGLGEGREAPQAAGTSWLAHRGDVNALAHSETGELLSSAGSDGIVRVWEAQTGRRVAVLRSQEAASVSLSVDMKGDFVASGSSDNMVRIWSLRTERLYRNFVGHSGNVYAVKFIPESQQLITGAADRTLRLWDIAQGASKQVLRSGSTCNGLDVSVDGKTPVSAHQDGGLRLWDLRSGNVTTIIRAFDTQATSVMFGGPTSAFTILANSRDNTIKVIDSRTFETVYTLKHPEYRTSLNWSRACFSPSTALVAAGSGDGTVCVWNVQTGEVQSAFKDHKNQPVTNCSWSCAGSTAGLATCDKSGRIICWA